MEGILTRNPREPERGVRNQKVLDINCSGKWELADLIWPSGSAGAVLHLFTGKRYKSRISHLFGVRGNTWRSFRTDVSLFVKYRYN